MQDSCNGCKQYKYCKVPCKYIDAVADGNVRLKERLLSDLQGETGRERRSKPYTEVISEIMANKRNSKADHIYTVCEIEDYRTRAIAAMLIADIPVSQIAGLINISRVHIYRLIRQAATTS